MLPDLDGDDYDIKTLSRDELDLVPFVIVKWQCKIKFCKCGTRLRDYGLHPVYYWPSKSKWIDTQANIVLCGNRGHWKRYGGKRWEEMPLKKLINGTIVGGRLEQPGKQTIVL